MTREGASQVVFDGDVRTMLGGYELLRPLAQGGMADVYLARRAGGDGDGGGSAGGSGAGDGHVVALKILNEHRALDRDARALFLHEARICALLHHQNIAGVLEVGAAEGQHYLAMEYIDGVDLRELLAATAHEDRGIPYEVAISIVTAAAAGLGHAHGRCDEAGAPLQLVHRDVSLSNIMVSRDGGVKVVDFGIATTTISDVHTVPGVVRGKASYMSPEQCMGEALDHRTDVFALGVVLYELTTGARCFHGKSDFERMLAVVRGDYLPPSELVEGYPPELEGVIRTALALAPAERYGSCEAMIEALEGVLAARGWFGGALAIARLMAEVRQAPAAPAAPAAEVVTVIVAPLVEGVNEVNEVNEATTIEPAITARQPVVLEVLAASGAIPPHALAIASAPTAPKLSLARGSTRRIGRAAARATAVAPAPASSELPTRALWTDEDALTRGRRAPRRSTAAGARAARRGATARGLIATPRLAA